MSYQIPKKNCEIFCSGWETSNLIIGTEKKLTNLLKELKATETISETDYKKLKPRGSSFAVLYGLWKTHKKVLEKCQPFRPIFVSN